jgi:hypothetical protein
MQSAQDCMGDDVPEAVDRAPVRRILSERNMRTPPIIIGGEFRKDPCACRKSNPDILVMQPAQDRKAKNVTDGPNGARYRRILI